MTKTKNELMGNLQNQFLVQKSDPLLMMKDIPFTLGELKIFDIYLSRINASDKFKRTVVFSKEEYEELLGFTDTDGRTLARNTEKLLTKTVKLKVGKYFDMFVLFEKAQYCKDEQGREIVILKCTESAKDFFFFLSKYHYVSYELKNILSLTSKHSYLLYMHIRSNRYRKNWTISVTELRNNIFDLEEVETYKQYKRFKEKVLDPATRELNQKTDCRFEFRPIKRGRNVIEIEFLCYSENQTCINTESTEQENNCVSSQPDENCLYFSSALDYRFSETELKEIVALLDRLYPDYDNQQKYNCLRCSWYKFLRYNETKTINNKLQYLKTIINNDYAELPKREEKEHKKSKGEEIAKKYEIFTKMV